MITSSGIGFRNSFGYKWTWSRIGSNELFKISNQYLYLFMRLIITLFIILSVVVACDDSEKRKGEEKITSSENNIATVKIEDIKLLNLNDAAIDMGIYKGKALFLNFWATWCKPCIEEMPTIKRAMDSLKNEDIIFLFASEESAEDIQRFEAKHNFGFNYVKAVNMEESGIMALPTTFIFDKTGKQIFSEMGYQKWDNKTNLEFLLKIAKQE